MQFNHTFNRLSLSQRPQKKKKKGSIMKIYHNWYQTTLSHPLSYGIWSFGVSRVFKYLDHSLPFPFHVFSLESFSPLSFFSIKFPAKGRVSIFTNIFPLPQLSLLTSEPSQSSFFLPDWGLGLFHTSTWFRPLNRLVVFSLSCLDHLSCLSLSFAKLLF